MPGRGKLWVAWAAVTALAVAMGCGRSREKTAEKALEKMIEAQTGGKASVDLSQGRMTVKTDDGELTAATGAAAKIPEDFPKDVFVPADASVRMVSRMPNTMMVWMAVRPSPAQVCQRIGTEMATRGWEKEMSMETDESQSLGFKKQDRRVLYTATRDEEGTQVTVVISREEG